MAIATAALIVCGSCEHELREDIDLGLTTVATTGEGGTGAYCGLSADHSHHIAARDCTNCEGIGTVETCTFGVGLHEVRCPGEDQSGNCDDGIVR